MRDRSANYYGDGIILEGGHETFLEETKKGFVVKVRGKTTTLPGELETGEYIAPYDWGKHSLVVKLIREKTQEAVANALGKKQKKKASFVGRIEESQKSSSISKIVVPTGLDVIGARIFESLNHK